MKTINKKLITYLDSRTSAERKEDGKIKTTTTMTQKAQENWKDKIRLDYAGIISLEQIKATIIYWEDFISAQTAKAREEGYQEGLFLRKEYNDPELLSKICSEELKKAREEEYKKGYNDCLREQKLTGEKYEHLYL